MVLNFHFSIWAETTGFLGVGIGNSLGFLSLQTQVSKPLYTPPLLILYSRDAKTALQFF